MEVEMKSKRCVKCRQKRADRLVTVGGDTSAVCELCGMQMLIDATVHGENAAIGNMPILGLLTVSQVAQMVNLHPNTIRRWETSGVLKGYRVGKRGDRRFAKEEVEQFLRGKKEVSEAKGLAR